MVCGGLSLDAAAGICRSHASESVRNLPYLIRYYTTLASNLPYFGSCENLGTVYATIQLIMSVYGISSLCYKIVSHKEAVVIPTLSVMS